MNAGYGALANEHFLYFKVQNAEAITLTGQLVNRWTCSRVEKHLTNILKTEHNYWVYSDTDSGHFSLKPLYEQALSKIDDKEKLIDSFDQFEKTVLGPFVERQTDDLSEYLNSYANRMVWGREAIAESAIYLAKKRYTMKVWDNEGVRYHNEPKIKITGLESVRSSTPSWARKYLEECYGIALDNDQDKLHSRVLEIKKAFMDMSVHDIAIPRGVNNVDKYHDSVSIYGKGTPKHVKAALIHNWYTDQLGLKHIPKIVSGDKIKFIELKRPNPINQDVIGFVSYMPAEFKLDQFVDREAIFDSAFLNPLQSFLNAIGWNHEPIISLESFFG